MARRRLHGATQQRRQKQQTRALKRQGTVARVRATQAPAPFERSTVLERDDVTFLEAMRELAVAAQRRLAATPAREEVVRRRSFAAQADQANQFESAMSRLGVEPLPEPRGNPPRAAAPRRTEGTPSPQAGREAGWEAPPADSPRAEGNARPRVASPPNPAVAPPRTEGTPPHLVGRGGGGDALPAAARPAPTVFRGEADDAALMAEAFAEGAFDPARKFEGAPPPARQPGPHRRAPSGDGPDRELDLHGRTLDEALRMLAQFMDTAHQLRLRHVLVITGKGQHSGPGGPVLRHAVVHWLERHGRPYVQGWLAAPARFGGEGALWITLR
ncbi:MAG: Smr/MutS family protein [Candidatus Lambdaproteobacteria bacterium]|nr:Smr/MutS family protein [Candidatus Lambdaproteobacteria bacterium]